RPELRYADIAHLSPPPEEVRPDVAEQVEIQIKYQGYIDKLMQEVEKMKRLENKRLSESLDYNAIHGLSSEAREKLSQVRPLSIGQAARISGVNPADISILMIYLEQMERRTSA